MKKSLNRRSFLQLSALTGVATGIPFTTAGAQAASTSSHAGNGVSKYVRLGRTDLEISDISFGSSRLRTGEEHLVHHALDKGVNYIDTAESYTNGASETVIGKALKGRSRNDVYIATKASIRANDSAASIMERLDDSLRRLQTDYVDVFFTHAVNDVERLK
ncbi:MAG: aldo/keto reductase [Gammaproteobacteria bacterium]|nr:aldo/keto reductase [Gammaproteobacteria bacterium]